MKIFSFSLTIMFHFIFLPYLQVTKWLSCEGEPHLQDIKERTADSLSAIIAVQKDFEKFYFKAMVSDNSLLTQAQFMCRCMYVLKEVSGV